MATGPGAAASTATTATATATSPGAAAWFALDVDAVVAALGSDLERGLTRGDAASRLGRYGPNEIAREKPPSVWAVALGQLRDPMNIMLVAVDGGESADQPVLDGSHRRLPDPAQSGLGYAPGAQGTRQRRCLWRRCRCRRPGSCGTAPLGLVPASTLVPGDVVQLEAGDIVPADGRIVRAATLETQEAALTGESAPVSKDAATLLAGRRRRSATGPTWCSRTPR